MCVRVEVEHQPVVLEADIDPGVVPVAWEGRQMILVKAVAAVGAAGMIAAGGGVTISHLQREVRVLQHQVYILNRTQQSYGLNIGGRQLVCIRIQQPSYGRQVVVLANNKCVKSG